MLLLLSFGFADVRPGHQNIALRDAHIRARGIFSRLCNLGRFDRSGVALQEGLPTGVDTPGIRVVRLSLLDACHGLLQIGFCLLGRGPCPSDQCLLLAVVEAGKDSALGDVIADVGTQIDDDAGHFIADAHKCRAHPQWGDSLSCGRR
nr:hypothetical protein [Sinorhizobium meliloti]